MARRLAVNVAVGEEWYGPAYGNADQVPDDVAAEIGDHCWETVPDGQVAAEKAAAQATVLEQHTKAELVALAGTNDVAVPHAANKAEIIDALRAAGVEG